MAWLVKVSIVEYRSKAKYSLIELFNSLEIMRYHDRKNRFDIYHLSTTLKEPLIYQLAVNLTNAGIQ
jgi:hypothetical protein